MIRILGGVCLGLGVALAPTLVGAQTKPDSATIAAITARYAEVARPGPEHGRLVALAGEWSVETALPGPGGREMLAQLQAVNRMIMGDRFLAMEVKGAVQGVPFESLTILGFDRGPGEYTAVGYDTFGTFYVTAAGAWDASAKTIVMKGSYSDAVTGHAHDYEFRLAIESADRFAWMVVFLEGEQRTIAAKLTYRRR